MFEESPAFVISIFTRVPALSVLRTCIGYIFVITEAKYVRKQTSLLCPSFVEVHCSRTSVATMVAGEWAAVTLHHSQEAERDECLHSAHFFLLCSLGTQPVG